MASDPAETSVSGHLIEFKRKTNLFFFVLFIGGLGLRVFFIIFIYFVVTFTDAYVTFPHTKKKTMK